MSNGQRLEELKDERIRNAARRMRTIVDSSTLRLMASPLDPSLFEERALDADRVNTLMDYLDHIMGMGVRVVIPETVVFETIGQDAERNQLTRAFINNPEFPLIDDFITRMQEKYPKLFSIESGELGKAHMDALRSMRDHFRGFNNYIAANKDMGDDDIVHMTLTDTSRGFVFVLCDDMYLMKRIPDTETMGGVPTTRLNLGAFVEEVTRVRPLPGIDGEMWSDISQAVVNAEIYHQNEHRRQIGRRAMTFDDKKPRMMVSEGGIRFGVALNLLKRFGPEVNGDERAR